ncbi:uncharacterized protein H6S33_006210 [Morchella sextelata]|uniref:uncharacterized protein n=1 Tax=Morchella sextelata TaxID=1174677 RepID=UPI001D05A65F|nr:uncharacterized protein H6S33_006210 [Morchella sextelata]KAH0614324.1 hypothetical protein H6S33_006210 [Morchella sextelata]
MTIRQNDAGPGKPVSNEESEPLAPVKCSERFLHGKLIQDLPHKCSQPYTINPSGRRIYKTQIECAFPECKAIFKKARQFDRHYRTVHIRAADQKLDCTIEGCRRTGEEGFSRKDNLIQHMRSVHGEEIPKNLVRFNGTRAGIMWGGWVDESQPRYLVKGTSGSIGLGVAG